MNYSLKEIADSVNTIPGIKLLDAEESHYAVDKDHLIGVPVDYNNIFKVPVDYKEQVVHCRIENRNLVNTLDDILSTCKRRGNLYVITIGTVSFGTELSDEIDVDEDSDVMVCKKQPYINHEFQCIEHDNITKKSDILPDELWFVKSTLKGK